MSFPKKKNLIFIKIPPEDLERLHIIDFEDLI